MRKFADGKGKVGENLFPAVGTEEFSSIRKGLSNGLVGTRGKGYKVRDKEFENVVFKDLGSFIKVEVWELVEVLQMLG